MRGAPLELERDKGSERTSDDPTPFEYLLGLMRRCEAFYGTIAGSAETISAMGDRERGSVLSTARRSMRFLARKPMRSLFASSSFDLPENFEFDEALDI